jgi:Response regulator receiver domain
MEIAPRDRRMNHIWDSKANPTGQRAHTLVLDLTGQPCDFVGTGSIVAYESAMFVGGPPSGGNPVMERAARPSAAEEPTVFVVDDDESMREALRRLFRSVKLKVETFGSTAEFLRSKLADVASCLVLDVRLPGISGSISRLSSPNRTSVSPHIHDRPRRHPDVGESHESRRSIS